MHTQRNGFIVVQWLAQGAQQPVFRDDDGQMFFDKHKHATSEIADAVKSIKDAIKIGDMDKDSKMSRNDYIIIPATVINPWAESKHQKITCVFDGEYYKMFRSDDDWTKIE